MHLVPYIMLWAEPVL